MSILLIATIYRCGEKVYPLVKPMAEKFGCDVLLLGQMSPKTPWAGDKDLRQTFYNTCLEVCDNVFQGLSVSELEKNYHNGKLLCNGIDMKKYKLVVIDDNLCKEGRGTPAIYRWAKHHNLPVLACPHGNREYDGYVSRQFEKSFDYSFVFGPKDVIGWGGSHRLIPAGIPANDILSTYNRSDKHILVIPNYTRKIDQKETGYHFFHEKHFVETGILELANKHGCKIVVKEKSRFPKNRQSDALKNALNKYHNVECIYDVNDDNQLVSESKYVISAPSTLAFKSIQLGIPTAILDGHGMIGSLHGFRGIVPINSNVIKQELQRQEELGKDYNFIDETLSGGKDFTSSSIYMKTFERFLNE